MLSYFPLQSLAFETNTSPPPNKKNSNDLPGCGFFCGTEHFMQVGGRLKPKTFMEVEG